MDTNRINPLASINQYWDEKKQNEPEPVLMAHVAKSASESPVFNLSILKQNIDNLDGMDDNELNRFIERSYHNILHNLFSGKEAAKYVKSFQNIRFLDGFIRVLSKMDKIDQSDIIRINTICYHYLVLDNKDSAVVSRMVQLSNIINRYYLPGLLGLGLSNTLASMLLIARFSDLDLNVCVKRVDFIIITQPKELMTEKIIEEIMRKLYDVMALYYRIFPYLMIDTIPDYDETDETTWWVTEDIDEVNSTLNLAILNILNTLPSNLIRLTLQNYIDAKNTVYSNRSVRFSLRNISEDYYRVKTIIYEMMYENINIP